MSISLVTESLIKGLEELENATTKKQVKIAVDKANAKSKLAKEVNSILKTQIDVIRIAKGGEVHIPNIESNFGLKLNK